MYIVQLCKVIYYLKKMKFSFVMSVGQRKNAESPMGIEPMASQIFVIIAT